MEKRRILAYVKKETAVFHKRVSVKTAVFLQPFRSIFSFSLSIDGSIKKKRHLDRAPQARARIVKASCYTHIIAKGFLKEDL